MKKITDKKSVALSSVFASLSLTVLKLIVGFLTGSLGILSEGIHSFLDLGAASLTLYAVHVGDKPADKNHHYGHQKIESVSALIETGLLFLTSIWIIYEALIRLFAKEVRVESTWYAYAIIILSIVVDYSRSRALLKAAKETDSQALEADALHFSSDIWSSSVVFVGLIFVALGFPKGDAIAALGVSLFVIKVGYSLGKKTIESLIDTTSTEVTKEISAKVKAVDGVIKINKIRIRHVGTTTFVDTHICVKKSLSVQSAHDICDAVENNIKSIIQNVDVTVHPEPI